MQHIGFIMDGNRRYAKKLSSLVTFGHKKGGDTLENVILYALEAQIPFVSFWTLSKENILERSTEELCAIYNLIIEKLPKLVEKFIHAHIALEVVGDLWLLPSDTRMALIHAMEQTQNPTPKMTVILALGYSGQDEIVRGVKRAISEGVDPTMLTEKEFLTYLDTGRYPPPDLIVRTGGNIRHSGYFLYQSAYSEYYFTDVLWPEFDKGEFQKALSYFDGVKRNFGK